MPMNDVFKISITFNILIAVCQNVSLLASANYQILAHSFLWNGKFATVGRILFS